MASLYKQKTKAGEAWSIQISLNDERRTIFLGKMSKKAAELIKSRIETIDSCNLAGMSYPPDVAQWLGEIRDDLHAKLSKLGLVPARRKTTLGCYCDQFLAKIKTKASTKRTMKQTTDTIIEYFGYEIDPKNITVEMVELLSESMKKARLSPSTIDKRIKTARQIFDAMIRAKIINENPFKEVKVTPTINEDRNVYVERERVERIIDTIPDPEWKLIIGLSRYCGLRAPSEILTLTWDCILWDKKRIVVRSPKTEHYEGKDSRVVPMFKGIRPLLEAVYDQAEPGGSPFVIARRRGIFDQLTDGRNTNLGTLFKKYILRAGETPWPKPFHAMRASFETDLLNDGRVKPHTIARWLGHSIQIALKHYARIKDEDFDAVTGDAESCAIPSMTDDVSPLKVGSNPSKTILQNHLQYPPEMGSNNLQRQSQVPKKTASCDLTQEAAEHKMTPTGFEPVLQA